MIAIHRVQVIDQQHQRFPRSFGAPVKLVILGELLLLHPFQHLEQVDRHRVNAVVQLAGLRSGDLFAVHGWQDNSAVKNANAQRARGGLLRFLDSCPRPLALI